MSLLDDNVTNSSFLSGPQPGAIVTPQGHLAISGDIGVVVTSGEAGAMLLASGATQLITLYTITLLLTG